MKSRALIFTMLASVCVATPLHAQVAAPYMEDTPIRHFSDEDLALFEKARIEALDRRPDGSAVDWRNAKTGASGTMSPLETDRRGDRECRLLLIVNRAGGMTGESSLWFCKMPDGLWKSTTPPKGNER